MTSPIKHPGLIEAEAKQVQLP
uniref:Uncharacterized protein n=1 Tax=Rhizophora mucronata TaxID=61149 RepID=A0A2P2NC57_RHIMU